MALSAEFIDQHIARYEGRLIGYRSAWPSRLFHHSAIENAIKILISGTILSRNDARQHCVRDVASVGAIANRDAAHNSARLYFRPKTPTQYYIEGIRKPADCTQGINAHAPILVMFVLNARQVLQLPGIRFSDRNMQRLETQPDDTEEYFSNIPFDKVFHDFAHNDPSITAHRCAEVLAPSPLMLAHCLQRVCCRSEAEKRTLLHLLPSRNRWIDKIEVARDITVFERRFVFVEDVSLGPEGVRFQLNPRRDRQHIDMKLEAFDTNDRVVVSFKNADWDHTANQRWYIPAELTEGNYRVRIEIEGHLGFEAKLRLGDKIV